MKSNTQELGAYVVRFLLVLLLASTGASLWAATPIIPPPPEVAGTSYVLIDAATEKVLVEHNLHEPMPPASLTKIMTSYVAAVELKAGRISMDDQVAVSVNAWKTPGSRMFIREGSQVSVSDLLSGIIIQSGNDASVALAEHIAGSEAAFADMMNQQAVVLGMTMTHFDNSTGLPSENHYTTAWDLALLTRSLIRDYPENYATYAIKEFTHNDIKQPNRNRLLWRDKTVDGVKTGHTEEAGYCLVASAERGGMRLISVVMGTHSDGSRMVETQKMLSYGFRYFETQKLYDALVPLKSAQLWYGEEDAIELGVEDEVIVTIPRGQYDNLEAELKVTRVVEAPVSQGQKLGELKLILHDEEVYRAPLVALVNAEEAGMFSRFTDFIALFFKQLLNTD